MRPLFPLLLLAVGCPNKPDDSSTSAICHGGTHWTAGHVAFRDATADWGLDVLNPEATRISAVDFDGDGWTDLALRRATDAADDFSAGGTRNAWLLKNTGQGGFEDVTESSGVRQPRLAASTSRGGQVWAFADVDNDGDLDLFTAISDGSDAVDETSEILLNNGDGTFALGPGGDDLHYDGDTTPASAAFTDYDRDGFVDLWVPEYDMAQDRLYRGNGAGSFDDVTYDADLNTKAWTDVDNLNAGLCHSVAWSGLACDLNGDGWPELMSASYGRAPNLLFQADGDGTYTNRAVDSGYAYDDRVDWTDDESARCWCHLHPDDEDCEGVPEPNITCNSDDDAFRWDHAYSRERFRLGGNSGATICADVDNDGWMDLLTTEIVHWDVGSSSDPSELLINRRQADVAFSRPGNEVTGLTREHSSVDWNDGDMTGAVFDFDNDGWPDVYIGSSDYPGARGLLWQNQGQDTFVSVDPGEGIDHHRSHGIGVADFDRDGDLDVVVGHSSARCDTDCYDSFNARFFENITGEDVGEQGNFVALHLQGTAANRAAIGARVQVTAGGYVQTQEVGGGHGHYGAQHDLVLHFGLGAACAAEVTVRWPDAELSEQTFTVGGGSRYLVVQGAEPVVE
ncbi:MAG: CRTAC1 family protein [Pseudomonadota bacterium]